MLDFAAGLGWDCGMQAGKDMIAFELLISSSSPRSGLVECLCWRSLEKEDGGSGQEFPGLELVGVDWRLKGSR